MANNSQRESTETVDNSRGHHHGGRELPDNVQDRPEQNAGYDAAVRGDDIDEDVDLDEIPAARKDEDLDLTKLDTELPAPGTSRRH